MKESVIIALSGKKGSGKNTLADPIADYFIDKWADPNCWSISGSVVSMAAFADLIKEFCVDVLGLEPEQCYGSEAKKNAPTKYLWDNTPRHKGGWGMSGPMTGRDVMQVFGTECVRTWFGNVWAEATIRKIRTENPQLAIITDNRFPSEVETILAYPRGHIIRLTRSPYNGDGHASEISLDDFNWCRPNCHVLDNAEMTRPEQEEAIIPILQTIFQQELGNGRI